MSSSTRLRRAGNKVLARFCGETLLLLVADQAATSVTGTINRKVARIRDGVSVKDGTKLDFSILGLTEIEVDIEDATPSSGDEFVDGFNFRHRVKFVTFTDVVWVCYCVPSKIAEGLRGVGGEYILGVGGERIGAIR